MKKFSSIPSNYLAYNRSVAHDSITVAQALCHPVLTWTKAGDHAQQIVSTKVVSNEIIPPSYIQPLRAPQKHTKTTMIIDQIVCELSNTTFDPPNSKPKSFSSLPLDIRQQFFLEWFKYPIRYTVGFRIKSIYEWKTWTNSTLEAACHAYHDEEIDVLLLQNIAITLKKRFPPLVDDVS